MIQSSIQPRLTGVRIRAVSAGNGHIIVIKVPASWNPPHRVIFKNANRFWIRNSNGAHEPGIHELRVLFTSTATARDRLKAFRELRIAKIAAGEAVVPLKPDRGRLVLHLLPYQAFSNPSPVDLKLAYQNFNSLAPMRSAGYSPNYTFEGFLNASLGTKASSGYVQLFRNGELESVKAATVGTSNHDGTPSCPADFIENQVIKSAFAYLTAFKVIGISPPFFAAITLIDVRGCVLTSRRLSIFSDVNPLAQSILPLPEIQIDDYWSEEQVASQLRSAFDALWNAAGFPGSQNFDDEGKWQLHP